MHRCIALLHKLIADDIDTTGPDVLLRLGDPPAPVVAQAPGFHHTTAQRHQANAGGTWNDYTAGRSPV